MLGKRIAFQALGLGGEICNQFAVGLRHGKKILARSQAGILNGLRDVEHGEAFGDHHRVHVDVASDQAVM